MVPDVNRHSSRHHDFTQEKRRYPLQDSRPGWIRYFLSCRALASPTTCRLSGKAMARTGLRMMPTFPSPPLKFRTAGFPQYGFKAGLSKGAYPAWAPNCRAPLVCNPPERLSPSTLYIPALCRGSCALERRHSSGLSALPQGPSLRSGLCCPGPSSLSRPHPPHSRAHPDFAIWWLIRDAIAVPIRIGLGDPRLVLSFH